MHGKRPKHIIPNGGFRWYDPWQFNTRKTNPSHSSFRTPSLLVVVLVTETAHFMGKPNGKLWLTCLQHFHLWSGGGFLPSIRIPKDPLMEGRGERTSRTQGSAFLKIATFWGVRVLRTSTILHKPSLPFLQEKRPNFTFWWSDELAVMNFCPLFLWTVN